MSSWQCPDCGSIGTPYVAEIDALRARAETLEYKNALMRDELKEIERAIDDPRVHNTITMAEAVAQLRARVAELEAENARLREIPCWTESEDGNPGWGKTADAVEMLGKAYARIEKLKKIETVLRDLVDNISTPTLDDLRLDYVEVQVDRKALAQARLALVEKQQAKTS